MKSSRSGNAGGASARHPRRRSPAVTCGGQIEDSDHSEPRRERRDDETADHRAGCSVTTTSRTGRRLTSPWGKLTVVTGSVGLGQEQSGERHPAIKALARSTSTVARSQRGGEHRTTCSVWSTSTRSSPSTRALSGARRARTQRPTPTSSAHIRESASPRHPRRGRVATSPDASASTSSRRPLRGLLRVTDRSRSRCTSCPTSTSPARSAAGHCATTARPCQVKLQGDEHRRHSRTCRSRAAQRVRFRNIPSDRTGSSHTLVEVGLGYIRSRSARDDPVGRRGAACEAGDASSANAPPVKYSLPARRTDHRSSLRRCRQAPRACCTGWSIKGNTVVIIEHNLEVIKYRRLVDRPRPRGW